MILTIELEDNEFPLIYNLKPREQINMVLQLIKTGYIGNRIRLILGTFWIKYLLIDPLHPKYGSQVGFSYYLVDCNTSQNKLNHQWFIDLDLSGRRFSKKGCNSLTGRMMRIDNLVIKKFDPDCEFILEYIPELKDIKIEDIHNWENKYTEYKNIYYKPAIDYSEARKETLKEMYRIAKL